MIITKTIDLIKPHPTQQGVDVRWRVEEVDDDGHVVSTTFDRRCFGEKSKDVFFAEIPDAEDYRSEMGW